jgi:prepilin peptidase CpaA
MSVLLFAVFPLAMIFGALWDLTTMTIPNVLTAALAAAFFPLAFIAGFGWQEIGLHVGAGVLMLVVGMALFAFGWIGDLSAGGFCAGRRVDAFHPLLPFAAASRLHGAA